MVGLKQGDSGERVAYLQYVLIEAGYPVGPKGADGEYGSKTVDAVLKCRKDQGSQANSGTPISGAAAMQILKAFVQKVAGVK
jgi:peptidoglycan hydrolase-like protein with peptidoglycan-binding domain